MKDKCPICSGALSVLKNDAWDAVKMCPKLKCQYAVVEEDNDV